MKFNLLKITFLLLAALFVLPVGADAQRKKKKKGKEATEMAEEKKAPKKKEKFKPYKDIITKDARTEEGLFTVHKVDGTNYFEIPFDLLEREMLVVSRISGFVKNLNFGGAGMKSRPQQVIRFQRMDDKLLLRSVSYNSVATPDDPIYQSVRNNNFEPIVATFDIKTFNPDSTAAVIEIDPLFTKDVEMIGALRKSQRKQFGIKRLDSGRSFVVNTRAFPENVMVRHVLTYDGSKLPDNAVTDALSIEMIQSFILLPENPMMPRYYDSRVSYFSIQQTDYSSDEQKAAQKRFITRWRLEPKDPEAYFRGELVEPVKPIIYYIDPAAPKKWVPYLKQGVEDWQKAFEAAGFKNAIIAREAPTNDPDWNPEDVRYSVMRYISTDIQNAQGPHVHDPRTGEILESDILWYHNIMNLLRNWYFVQTAAANPDARKVKVDDAIMGELLRFVSAHEVGHTLGLPHNMGSSPAYPVDSLRSPTFTATHGTAPSIMDYARFNYVAQPGDGVTQFYPQIGEYDIWSIIYGYKLTEATTPEADERIVNGWIRERADDPVYRFGAQTRGLVDPSAQTEDLGDDAMRASEYGIANLKRMVPNLIEWTSEDGKEYDNLEELYGQIWEQLSRYAGHVTSNVGGVYNYRKTADEAGAVYVNVPKERQQRAVQFINQQIFQTPTWLMNKDILRRADNTSIVDRMRSLHSRTLSRLFSPDRLNRLSEAVILEGNAAYSAADLFNDTRWGIFSELNGNTPIDAYRRNLQRAYVDKLADLMKLEESKYDFSDTKAMARYTLIELQRQLKSAAGSYSDALSKMHVVDLEARIADVLEVD